MSQTVNYYLRHAIAPGTTKAYLGAAKRYTDWALDNGLTQNGKILVPNERGLIWYATWAAGKGHTPGYIKSTLSGVSYYFEGHGHPSITKDTFGNTLPTFARVLRGISRMRTDEKRERPPLTTDLMKQVLPRLGEANPNLSAATVAALQAAMTAGVYGLLRISELMPEQAKKHDPIKDTRASDVKFYPTQAAPEYYTIRLRTSKCDVFRRSSLIRVFATGTSDCPVAAMLWWMQWRRGRADPGGPLFRLPSGKNLTRQVFTAALRRTLVLLGHDGKAYASHSLRAGGAVSLAAAGYGSETIQMLGRWASQSFMAYLVMSNHTARDAQHAMATVGPGDVTEEEHRRYRNRFDE